MKPTLTARPVPFLRLAALVLATALLAACGARPEGGQSGLETGAGDVTASTNADGTAVLPGGETPADGTVVDPGAPGAADPSGVPGATDSGGGAGGADPGPGTAPAPGGGGAPAPGADKGVTTGVGADVVKVGLHLPQSGAVGTLIGHGWKGAEAWFREVNARGGVHGRKIKLEVVDDGYSAEGSSRAIRNLVDDRKVFAVLGPLGVDQQVVAAAYANSKGVPYINGGNSEEAVAKQPWVFPASASNGFASERLVDYLFDVAGYTPQRKIGGFYLNSEVVAVEQLGRLERRLAAKGSQLVVKAPAEKDQTDFSSAIIKMRNAGVDTVWYHTDPTLIAKFTAQAKALRFEPAYVYAITGGDLYAQAAGGNLDGAIGIGSLADPQWSGGSGFKALLQKHFPDEEPDEFLIASYVMARVFVEGALRAGPGLGRTSFARGLASVDAFDTGISTPISLTQRPRHQAGNGKLAIFQVQGSQVVQKTGFDF